MESKPWEEAKLAASSHAELYARRNNATQEEQNKLAPYEHRAFAREAVADNPLMAVPLAVAAPVYQASKALGMEQSRSEASTKQVTEAYKGIGEGLAKNAKKPWEEAVEAASGLMMYVDKKATEVKKAVGKLLPWEEAQQSVAPSKAPTKVNLDQGWDKINADYAKGKPERDRMQLSLLEQEREKAKDPKVIAALDREIKRAQEAITKPKGMIEAGNIDLKARPVVKNADGSISTVRSIGVNMDGKEVLIPTVSPDGKILTDKQAIDLYRKTGKHLGKFSDPAASDRYAQQLHNDQERMYVKGNK